MISIHDREVILAALRQALNTITEPRCEDCSLFEPITRHCEHYKSAVPEHVKGCENCLYIPF